jgi:hypothetical protein
MSALESLWDQATNFQMFSMYTTEELRRLVAPHELLVDVVERADAAEIEQAVSRHIDEARANLLRKLSYQPSAISYQPSAIGHQPVMEQGRDSRGAARSFKKRREPRANS